MDSGPVLPGFPTSSDYSTAREVLRAAGYTGDDVPADAEPPALMRAFSQGATIAAEQVRRELVPMRLEDWVAAGLLSIDREDEGLVRATVRLQACDGDVYAVERRAEDGEQQRPDAVMAIGSPSRLLSRLTVRGRRGLALDLGCGCGVHALQAARHCERVIGVDLSQRAVDFSRFNAALNDRAHVSFAQGDLYAQVAAAAEPQFDLIVSHPPLVLSPQRLLTGLDSGRPGDDLLREILQGAAPRLNQEGVCQVLGNWIRREGQDEAGGIFDWLDMTGCDVFIVRGQEIPVEDYPRLWTAWYGGQAPDEAGWQAYLKELGAVSIIYGLVTVRRITGRPNYLRLEDADAEMTGATIERWLAAPGPSGGLGMLPGGKV